MHVPDDRKYTEEHEWVMEIGAAVRVGITDYAQDALGDVVYVDLPEVGASFGRDDSVAEIESTKSVAEIYAPIAGTVSAVNQALDGSPELVNSDPYGDGWMFELTSADDADKDLLLPPDLYRALTED